MAPGRRPRMDGDVLADGGTRLSFDAIPEADGAEAHARPLFVRRDERSVLQYLTRLRRPRQLALRGLDRHLFYDVGRGELHARGPGGDPLELPRREQRRAFERLIHTWEAVRFAAISQNGRDY